MNIEELSAELRHLREQMNLLLDKQAIQDCITRYARGLDRHDEEVLASVYHEDGIDHHGHLFLGARDDFVPWANALHEMHWNTHTHYMANHRVEIDGDVAHAETYVLYVLRRKDGGTLDLGGGRYLDRLERRNGEWKIAVRQIVTDWHGEAKANATASPENTGHAVMGTWDRNDPSYQRPLRIPAARYKHLSMT